jgi:hypothetical protein
LDAIAQALPAKLHVRRRRAEFLGQPPLEPQLLLALGAAGEVAFNRLALVLVELPGDVPRQQLFGFPVRVLFDIVLHLGLTANRPARRRALS